MTLRDTSRNLVQGQVTTKHPASNFGLAVLVVDGHAVDPSKAGRYEVVEATAEELFALQTAGYWCART